MARFSKPKYKSSKCKPISSTLTITEGSPVRGLGTEAIANSDCKGFYNRLVKRIFEERAKVIVVSIRQVAAAGIDYE